MRRGLWARRCWQNAAWQGKSFFVNLELRKVLERRGNKLVAKPFPAAAFLVEDGDAGGVGGAVEGGGEAAEVAGVAEGWGGGAGEDALPAAAGIAAARGWSVQAGGGLGLQQARLTAAKPRGVAGEVAALPRETMRRSRADAPQW